MTKSMFRNIGILEGLSFLILLGIAMPMKYVWGIPEATKITGLIHGLLFLAYIAGAYQIAQDESWQTKRLILAFGAAVVPFGPFIFDRKYLK